MTRKDYVKLADAFSATRAELIGGTWKDAGTMLRILQNRVTEILAADNPNFDRERFTEACEAGGSK